MKKILVLSNDYIFLSKKKIYSKYNDTINILESINEKFNIELISRKLYKKDNFSFDLKNKIIRFNYKFSYFSKKKIKIFMISITPRNFFFFLLLSFSYNLNGFVYLRSDGFKEYKNKFGSFGYFIYGIMINLIKKKLKILSVSNSLEKVKVSNPLKPSELDKQWFSNIKKADLNFPKLLYFGRFKKEKGVYSLIKLVRNIKTKFLLTIAGDNLKNNKKIKNIHFQNEILFKKKVIKLYDNHNIFILPSYTEGYPKVLLESLARLRPVIVFNEIKHVKSSFNGVFVINRDIYSLKKTIYFIMKNYKKIQKKMKFNNLPTRENFKKNIQKLLDV